MAWHRYGTFSGGLDLPELKRKTLDRAIEPLFVPPHLIVPLGMPGRAPGARLIEPGKSVRTGQVLAKGDGYATPDILAPLSGRVAELTTAQVASAGRFVEVDAVKINSLKADPPPDHPSFGRAWRNASPDDLCAFIADSAMTTFRQPVIAMSAWLEQVRQARIDTLVLNVMECQPYLTCGHRLLIEYGPLVLTGLAILARAIGVTEVTIAVDQRRAKSYSHLFTPANELNIQLIALPHKYPIGADPILLEIITGREIPMGQHPIDVGAAVIDPETALAVARWVATGDNTLARVVTLDGPLARNPMNVMVPLGTPCAALYDMPGMELTHGGPMTGLPCKPNAVVSASTRTVLALARETHATPTACLRCGWCTDLCPTRLNVSKINDAFELADLELARQGGALACVHCGVCSYICPARLPLTHRVSTMKHVLSQNRQLCDLTPPMPAATEGTE